MRVITIQEFPLAWRWTDPKHVELPAAVLAQICPLDHDAAAAIHDRWVRNITNTALVGSPLVPLKRGDGIAWTKEIHFRAGNLGFGDGRVEAFRNGSVEAVIRIGGGTTNWLAVP